MALGITIKVIITTFITRLLSDCAFSQVQLLDFVNKASAPGLVRPLLRLWFTVYMSVICEALVLLDVNV